MLWLLSVRKNALALVLGIYDYHREVSLAFSLPDRPIPPGYNPARIARLPTFLPISKAAAPGPRGGLLSW
jgi:hypothetical protein